MPITVESDVTESMHHEINESLTREPKRTPLPKFQLFIVFLIQFAEPVTATVIYPFINQFIRNTDITGGDERKTGYYAGMIGSIFFLSEALTVFHWGWLSDRIGRRPILLIGPIGLCLAMIAFGLAENFWMLVASRCLQGIFNGNIGVSKIVIAEITDPTNIADAFAMIPLMWGFGITAGAIIGGILAEPATHWPRLFGEVEFFHYYPYFLPCAAAAFIAFLSGFFAFIGLKETLPSIVSRRRTHGIKAAIKAANIEPNSTTRLISYENGARYGSNGTAQVVESGYQRDVNTTESDKRDEEAAPPFKELLIPQVMICLLVYAFLSFTDMSAQVLQPLVYSTSIPFGGLGFDPYRIGVIMGIWGVTNAILQLLFLGKAMRRFGPKNMLLLSLAGYITILGLYPFLSLFAQSAGKVDAKVWVVIIIQLICQITNSVAHASIQIIIVDSAPSRGALGATNGMAQAIASGMRAVAPSAASSLFSISLERHLIGGNMVYLILIGIALIGLRIALLLPKHSRSQSSS